MGDEGKVTLECRGAVGIITIDHPPVNALSDAVFAGLAERFREAGEMPGITAIVLTGAGRNFSAGMDLSAVASFSGPEALREQNPRLYALSAAIEDSPKPVVAALKGAGMGGGLEFALCCHYRVADDTAQIGLPEVSVGLIPGMAGTQRLPRLVGLEAGIEMVCGGKSIPAKKALELGLVDKRCPAETLLEDAIAFAIERVQAGGPYPKARERADKLPPEQLWDQVFDMARAQVGKQAGRMIAPMKALDAIEAGVRHGYKKGLDAELANFIACVFEGQGPALTHVFFASRATVQAPELGDYRALMKPVRSVAVVGGGFMGRDIAFVCLLGGKDVALIEADQERLDAAAGVVRGHFQRRVEQGRMTADQMDEALARLTPTLEYADIAGADCVIEAVFEKMDLKQEVLAKVNAVVSKNAVIASNTSTLPITELAEAVDCPERVIGLHFFSPVRVMPLLEMVRTAGTSRETIATCFGLAKDIKKTAILVKDCYGFLTNRILMPYGQEATKLLEEGATVQDVDAALVEFGMPMGPFAMCDMAGIDIIALSAPGMMKAYPDKYRLSPILKALFAKHRYGQKRKKGFYRYEEGKREGIPDPEFDQIVEQTRAELGITPRAFSSEEILERVLCMWVNECAFCLEEGVALKPGDVDVATIMGFGFPSWRGGLMYHAEKQIGFKKIYDALNAWHAQFGEPRYRPSEWLVG